MPEPKTDRSAKPWVATTLRERDPEAWNLRYYRNVDKQRRRLLAEKCDLRAYYWDGDGAARWSSDRWERVCKSRASKLRTVAARLRGTK